MVKLPRVTGKAVLTALKRKGYRVVRINGSHHYLLHPDKAILVTVAIHAGQTIPPKTLKSILNQAGLTVEELIDLL